MLLQNSSPKILVVNPYGIGDALFCTPLIRTLKKFYAPKTSITLLLGSRTRTLFEFNPDIDQLFIYDKDQWRQSSFFQKIIFFFKLCQLRKKKFDLMSDLSNTDEYAFWGRFIWTIPIRIGFQYKKRGRYLTHRLPLSHFSDVHVVKHYYRLLSFLSITPEWFESNLFFYEDPQNKHWLPYFLTQHGISEKDHCIALLPGGGASWGPKAHYKYWPITSYVSLIQKLRKEKEVKIILLGGKEDIPLSQEVEKALAFPTYLINITGKTSLQQLAALLRFSKLLIGTESGPLHLATALDIPSFFLFGPVDPTVYGPYSNSQKQFAITDGAPCSPCYKNFRVPTCENRICLTKLPPERVYEIHSQKLPLSNAPAEILSHQS